MACQSRPAPSSLPFRDGFDDPNSGWTKVDTQQLHIAYQNSALHFTIDALDSTAWAVAGKNAGDFILDVDATQIEGPDDNHYGVIVRYADDKNFYRLDVSGDGFYSVSRYQDGTWVKPLLIDWTASAAINQGATTNHLRVIAEGSTLTLVVNGTPVGQVANVDIPAGDIGLTAGTFFNQAGVHVAFDNLEVNPLPQTTPQP
jgi:hypothetical protein